MIAFEAGVGFLGMVQESYRLEILGGRVGMSIEDECNILWLRYDDTFRTNADYVRIMKSERWFLMSEETVSRWFKFRFKRRWGFNGTEYGTCIQVPLRKCCKL